MNSTTDKSIVERIRVQSQQKEPQTFAGSDWRKAFNRYLDDVWSQKNMYAEGVLMIGEVILQLHAGTYRIQNPTDLSVFPRPNFDRGEVNAVTGERDPFELGIAKFMRNNSIRMFVAEFGCSRVMLWKSWKRAELHFTLVDRTF